MITWGLEQVEGVIGRDADGYGVSLGMTRQSNIDCGDGCTTLCEY